MFHLKAWGLFRCKIFTFAQPSGSLRVGGHAPVAARTERDATHFGAIGHAATFELLTEETAVERLQPMEYGLCVERRYVAATAVECAKGEPIDFGWREGVAQGVKKEEVVEFVGTNEVFGALADVAFGVGR